MIIIIDVLIVMATSAFLLFIYGALSCATPAEDRRDDLEQIKFIREWHAKH